MDTSHSTTPLFVQLPYQPPTIAADDVLCQATIPGNPVTKDRARFYAGKVYTTKKTRLGQEALQWALKAAFPHEEPNRTDDLGVSALFYTRTKQRCDIDNFLKLLLDACTGLIWGDDLQVSEVSSKVMRGDPHPRIELMIYRLPAPPAPLCETCHGPLPQSGIIVRRTKNARFCSKACYDVAQQKGRYVSCQTCGTRIYRNNDKLQQDNWYCSGRCRVLAYAEQKTCKVCGQAYSVSRSLAAKRASICSPACREAWHAQKRAASQKRGICPGCGSPCTHQKHRTAHCHRCYLKLSGKVNSQSITPGIEQDMMRLRTEGASIHAIAKTLGYSHRTVTNCLFLLENALMPTQLTLWEATG